MLRLMTICLLLTLNFGLEVRSCSHKAPLTERTVEYQNPRVDLVTSDLSFEPKSALDGVTVEGFEFSSESWEASDGVDILLRIQYCRSPKNAERALRQTEKTASRTFEEKVLINKDGKKVGRRIVVSFRSEMIQRPSVILWTDGDKFYSVESSSFQH